MKICSKCFEEKQESDFYACKNSSKKEGLTLRCKDCIRKTKNKWYHDNPEKTKEYERKRKCTLKRKIVEKRHQDKWRKNNPEKVKNSKLKTRYGITLGEYNNKLKDQDNKCYVCGMLFTKESKKTKPCLDHCHKTGKVRDILCNSCNQALGNVKESIVTLEKLIEYIKKYQ